MIGGHDILISTWGHSAAIDACLRVIHDFWPEAVFENAAVSSGVKSYWYFSIGCSNEVFAYRDGEIAKEWNEKGADPALCNTMIHVLLSGRTVTLVVDDPDDPQIAEMLRAVQLEFESTVLSTSLSDGAAFRNFVSVPTALSNSKRQGKRLPGDLIDSPVVFQHSFPEI
jgi:hypothetical protein